MEEERRHLVTLLPSLTLPSHSLLPHTLLLATWSRSSPPLPHPTPPYPTSLPHYLTTSCHMVPHGSTWKLLPSHTLSYPTSLPYAPWSRSSPPIPCPVLSCNCCAMPPCAVVHVGPGPMRPRAIWKCAVGSGTAVRSSVPHIARQDVQYAGAGSGTDGCTLLLPGEAPARGALAREPGHLTPTGRTQTKAEKSLDGFLWWWWWLPLTLHCMQSLAMRVLRRAGTLRAAGVRFVTDTWERGAEQDVAKWEEEREEVVEKVRAYNRSRVTLRLRSPLSSYALAATARSVHTRTRTHTGRPTRSLCTPAMSLCARCAMLEASLLGGYARGVGWGVLRACSTGASSLPSAASEEARESECQSAPPDQEGELRGWRSEKEGIEGVQKRAGRERGVETQCVQACAEGRDTVCVRGGAQVGKWRRAG
eukprot:868017-Rhodomonas_salina.2